MTNTREAHLAAKTIARLFVKDVTRMKASDVTEFVEELTRIEHRTNQQLVAPLFFKVIESWAQSRDDNNFDLRNEATVEIAKRMMADPDADDSDPRSIEVRDHLPLI